MEYIFENNYIKLKYENKIIGYVKIKENIIEDIYISEENRYVSFGKNLILFSIEHIKKQGFDKLIVKNFDKAKYNLLIKEGFILEKGILVYKGLQKEKKEEQNIFNASLISFLINLVLAILKVLVGFVFNLASILADGINSSADCITNLLVVVGCKISNSPEDEKRPFGYGKIESIFSLLIGAIMILSSFFALINCIKDIFTTLEANNFGNKTILIYSFTIFFILLKILQYFFIKHLANKYNNTLLKTIIKDYLSDILLSLSVLIGTILSIYFTRTFDILLASILNIYIIYQGILIIIENSKLLIDTQDENILKNVREILLSNNNIHYVHDLYMLRSNHNIYIYADVRVDKNLTVEKSHELAENVSLLVRKKITEIKRVTLHVEPIY